MTKTLTLFAGIVLWMTPTFAATTGHAPTDTKTREVMQAFEEFATPGAPHKMLQGLAGSWRYDSKWWMSADAQPEETHNGSATFKMIMGGRYLQQELHGKAMGHVFEGIGYIGYDNAKKKYVSTFLDNQGTGIVQGEGDYDADSKILSDKGTFSCPADKGDHQAEYRAELKIIDKNNLVYTMYNRGMGDDQKEFKALEMTYKRR